ncbi:MAG: helix-turn-helix transcriptional regulator [Clostridia bacterium]
MARPCEENGKRNLVSTNLIQLRKTKNWSQRDLANQLQLYGIDMDKNVITRIETNKRYVTDIEIKALSRVFDVSYNFLLDGKEQ